MMLWDWGLPQGLFGGEVGLWGGSKSSRHASAGLISGLEQAFDANKRLVVGICDENAPFMRTMPCMAVVGG